MSPRSLKGRRPSAALVISSAALFMSMGGVGAAATGLIGTSQIRNDAVTYSKIAPGSVGQVRLAAGGVTNAKLAQNSVSYKDIQIGAVGTKRANLNQLQERVRGTCAAGTAVGSVTNKGAVTCNATSPAQAGVSGTTATTLGATAATTASLSLTTGENWLGFGNTQLNVTSGATSTRVTVNCTMTVGSTTSTRTAIVRTDGTAGDVSSDVLPEQVAGAGGTSSVACVATVPSGSTLPTVTASSAINALQTATTG